MGLISTGIAIINLFPLPILDGGHLVLLLYEKIFSKINSASGVSDKVISVGEASQLDINLKNVTFSYKQTILR